MNFRRVFKILSYIIRDFQPGYFIGIGESDREELRAAELCDID